MANEAYKLLKERLNQLPKSEGNMRVLSILVETIEWKREFVFFKSSLKGYR